jgi:hypothetical protein
MRERVPSEEIGDHLIHLPVQIGESTASRFILDTGIGLNLVTSRLATRLGVEPNGEFYTGKRMSGQEVAVPLAELPQVTVGSIRRKNLTVGIIDLNLPAEMSRVEGFLSPGFFDQVPFTISRGAHHVILEAPESMEARLRVSKAVPIRIEKNGPSVSLFADLRLPNGTRISAEVDTGSNDLILDRRFMEALGVSEGSASVEKRDGTDETGHRYVRYSARIRGAVSLWEAPKILQADPTAIFQDIIYDGLLGDRFLREFDVTYDLEESRLMFSSPSVERPHSALL